MGRLVTSYTCRDTGCITDAETRGQKAEERREAAGTMARDRIFLSKPRSAPCCTQWHTVTSPPVPVVPTPTPHSLVPFKENIIRKTLNMPICGLSAGLVGVCLYPSTQEDKAN